jgi:cell division protein FtsW (lipid II flippase)
VTPVAAIVIPAVAVAEAAMIGSAIVATLVATMMVVMSGMPIAVFVAAAIAVAALMTIVTVAILRVIGRFSIGRADGERSGENQRAKRAEEDAFHGLGPFGKPGHPGSGISPSTRRWRSGAEPGLN